MYFRFNIKDEKRLLDLLKQLSNSMAMEISDNGHIYAKALSSSTLGPSSYYTEQLSGLSQVVEQEIRKSKIHFPPCRLNF